MDYMDPDVCCPQKAVKLNHWLTVEVWEEISDLDPHFMMDVFSGLHTGQG